MSWAHGGQTLNSISVTDIEKNTAESKGMMYGKHELDAGNFPMRLGFF
jgi:uncharacterized protein YgiM (DUF1202 family)